jgi:hypothetical protein
MFKVPGSRPVLSECEGSRSLARLGTSLEHWVQTRKFG